MEDNGIGFLDFEKKTCFLCIGNPLIPNDTFGVRFAAEAMKGICNPNWTIINCETVPENFMGKVIQLNPEMVIFIDTFDDGKMGEDLWITKVENVKDISFGTHKTSIQQLWQYISNFCHAEGWFIGMRKFEDIQEERIQQIVGDLVYKIKHFRKKSQN